MIIGTKVIGLPDLFDEGDMEDQFVQVQFDDGTFVNLNEEELKNAAALAEKGCLSD
jgi:ferredoxin